MELTNMPNSFEAKKILDKLLLHTRKMVIRRSFVFTLHEFYPKDSDLLGMNSNNGYIEIRLRTPENNNIFYSWEFILGTFLHELSHLLIKDHSPQFFKLLDTLDDEVSDDNNDFLINFNRNKYCRNLKFESNLEKGKKFESNLGKGQKLGGFKNKSRLLNQKTNLGSINKLGGNIRNNNTLSEKMAEAAIIRLSLKEF